MEERSVNCMLLGDSWVGKTCLLISYATDCFSHIYYPTLFEHYVSEVKIAEETIKLNIWYVLYSLSQMIMINRDTSAQESSASMRKCCYDNCDVFFVCFSVADLSSFENATSVVRCERYNMMLLVGT